MNSRPPPISAYAAGSFASFTVRERLPRILEGVQGQLGADPRWQALRDGVVSGGALDLRLFAAETAYWRYKLATLAGKTWREQSFFELEFLFYLAVRSIADDLRPGFDVFAAQRREALAQALPDVARKVEAADVQDLQTAVLLALIGNEADLSQLGSAAQSSISRDERPALLERLRSSDGSAPVHVLADNAGSELCFDLVLADALLAARSGAVVMHLKPRPMFVSDALPADVDESIAGFERLAPRTELKQIGERLRAALRDGRLVLCAPLDWAEPRHMNALEAELSASLSAAALVLAKGDLNYRRFFEDRAWPPDTPIAQASVASGMHAFALRVLKSDVIAGIDKTHVSHLFTVDAAWRSNGTRSIVQRVDRGSPQY